MQQRVREDTRARFRNVPTLDTSLATVTSRGIKPYEAKGTYVTLAGEEGVEGSCFLSVRMDAIKSAFQTTAACVFSFTFSCN